MLNGLDLFSGIGGGALALSGYVRPAAYCEIEPAAQAMLLTRMAAGDIPTAPIWDDVSTLRGSDIPNRIDIITGGFPCQDISVAGNGAGLAGKRSGLFYEIARLCGELKPRFIFLENVPAITTRGGTEVVRTLAALGYDCRWGIISAASVGAPHRRERWWLLAHSKRPRSGESSLGRKYGCQAKPEAIQPKNGQTCTNNFKSGSENLAHANGQRCDKMVERVIGGKGGQRAPSETQHRRVTTGGAWWATEPDVGRVAYGVPHRVDRIRGLGNAWVPAQARKAFEILTGVTHHKVKS